MAHFSDDAVLTGVGGRPPDPLRPAAHPAAPRPAGARARLCSRDPLPLRLLDQRRRDCIGHPCARKSWGRPCCTGPPARPPARRPRGGPSVFKSPSLRPNPNITMEPDRTRTGLGSSRRCRGGSRPRRAPLPCPGREGKGSAEVSTFSQGDGGLQRWMRRDREDEKERGSSLLTLGLTLPLGGQVQTLS